MWYEDSIESLFYNFIVICIFQFKLLIVNNGIKCILKGTYMRAVILTCYEKSLLA